MPADHHLRGRHLVGRRRILNRLLAEQVVLALPERAPGLDVDAVLGGVRAQLTLGALPPQEAAQLARTMLHSEGGASLATLARVAAESRGNPLFLRELSRWLTSAPRAPGERATVDAILGSRAGALSGGAQQVLQLIAEGRSNKEVAVVLDVGVSTIDSHRKHILEKLGLHNTADLVRFAVRHGLVVP